MLNVPKHFTSGNISSAGTFWWRIFRNIYLDTTFPKHSGTCRSQPATSRHRPRRPLTLRQRLPQCSAMGRASRGQQMFRLAFGTPSSVPSSRHSHIVWTLATLGNTLDAATVVRAAAVAVVDGFPLLLTYLPSHRIFSAPSAFWMTCRGKPIRVKVAFLRCAERIPDSPTDPKQSRMARHN